MNEKKNSTLVVENKKSDGQKKLPVTQESKALC